MMNTTCLLVLLAIFVPPSISLQCWSHFCERGSFCIETCSSNQTSCVASYHRTEAGDITPTYFACSSTTGGLCLLPECTPSPNPGNIYSCCCRGDLCNNVPGITPGTVTPPTVPPVPEGYIVCEAYNCSAAGGTCYHGYQSCADHPLATVDNTPHHHYCQATYRKNEDGLYALYHKGCLIDGDTATKQRCSGACSIDTESGQQTLNCCCDDYLCNRNVTATNPTRLVGREPDECAGMGCDHSCILHNGNPTCLCRAGYSLSQDGRSCEDIDECQSSPCNVTCVNTEGSFRCECPLGQRLADDGISCHETGLVCQFHQCNGQSCPDPSIKYCDDQDPPVERSRQICQATYTRVGDGSFRPGLLSCFSKSSSLQDCGTNMCTLYPLNDSPSIYFCCCTEDLCNVQIVFPNETTTTLTTISPTSRIVTVRSSSSTTPTSSSLPNGTTTDTPSVPTGTNRRSLDPSIIGFVIVFLIVIAIIIVAGGAVYCCIRRTRKKLQTLDPSNVPDDEALFTPPDYSESDVEYCQKIGQGRYADVWEGKLKDGRVVAVKEFRPQARQSWQQELSIYLTPDIQHKNVMLYCGCDTNMQRLMLEYHAKGSLYELLSNKTISLAEFCILAETAALGIAHLHSEKIVDGVTRKPAIAHRDLKSKNIMISQDNQCVISDFGLAWKFEPGKSPMEAQGQVGTTRYMAPEVLEGAINFQRESFLRIDIYALALIIWEMSSRTEVNGVVPHEYKPPFEDVGVSPNPTMDEMRVVVVQSQMRPKIPKAFINADMDTIPQTIEEAWDQDSEARLSAQCIAERIRSFRQSKAGASFKDSGYLGSATNNESLDSTQSPYTPQPQTPSYCSSMTMSPLEMKPTESILPPPHSLALNNNDRRGGNSGNVVVMNQQRMSVSQFDIQHQYSRVPPQTQTKNSALMYNMHSTETTV